MKETSHNIDPKMLGLFKVVSTISNFTQEKEISVIVCSDNSVYRSSKQNPFVTEDEMDQDLQKAVPVFFFKTIERIL